MTPSQKGRHGCEAARNPKWRIAAPPVPALRRPVGVPQPWPIHPHPARHVHRSHFPPPPPPLPPPPHHHHQLPLFHTRHAGESAERPHLVTVVRPCAHSTLRKVTVLLNRRGVVSFEQLLLDLSEALGFPRWHRARVTRLYTTHAREVKGVCDFFRGEVAFLALGKARPELSSVHEALEELFPEHSHYRADALRAWERRLRPPPDKAAKADSGYSEGTDGSGVNQETHRDTDAKNHRNAGSREPERCNFDSERSDKKSLCRKPAHPPNHLQRLHIRGGARPPFPHEDAFREEDVPSPTLCENCLSRRGKHQGAELIDTLSGRVPLPPVSRKPKESPPAEQEAKNDTSPPQPEEKSSARLINSSSDADAQGTSPSDRPSEDGDVTPSDIERRYDVGRVVGDGNFAVVRECRRRDSGQTLAMKIVERSKLIGREHMMQNELSLLGSLRHPRIVRLFAHHHTRTHSYLVMELVSGGDLFEAISESGKFSEAAAGLMVSDVSEALNYIHRKSIVHRDLKPENLLIEQVAAGICRLKLADFGLAMVVTEPVFTICGTPTYVAPEILCETGYGVEVDVWALGVILYILLCGFPPFRSRDRDQEELFQLIKQGQLHFPSPYWDSISEEARGLIRALLQPDPTVRLAAEQTLLHPWVKAMASICKQGAPTDRSLKTIEDAGAEPERLRTVGQTDSAESQGNKASGHDDGKAGIGRKDLRLYDERQTNKNRGSETDELQKQNIRERNSVQATSEQIEDRTSGQEGDLDSTEQHRPQNPGVQRSDRDYVDLNQSHEAQADPSSLIKTRSNLTSPQASHADSHPPNNTAGPSAPPDPSLGALTHSPPRHLTPPLHNPTAAPLR